MSGSGFGLAAQALLDALAGLDARLVSGADAARGVELLARVEKVCAAARVKLASRAAECDAFADSGFSTVTEWLARQTGTHAGEAKADLELAVAVEALDDTRAALDRGDVSLKEAREIVKTEQACPGSEAELLGVAKHRGLRGVREVGRRKRQEALDPEVLAAKRRQAREFSHWEDELGMICGRFRLEPQVGVPLMRRLDAEIDRAWRKGDADYRAEPRERRAADVFGGMVASGEGKGFARRPDLAVVWDLNAERAHIPGVGPIGWDALREIAKDAFVTGVVHDGTDIEAFIRHGRHIPEALRLLLEIGPASSEGSGFDGLHCLDCGRKFHLQIDHLDPVANQGPTCLENLDWRCPHCHRTKTRRDREAGLLGPHPPGAPTPAGKRAPP